MSAGGTAPTLTIAMVETSVPNLGQDFIGKTLDEVADTLATQGLERLYESRTGVLSPSQRQSYERLLAAVPSKLTVFLDPIILSFALKDACDLSSSAYVWLDLEGNDDLGNAVWTETTRDDEILQLMTRLVQDHLEKYVIDAYDRLTREDMTRVWEAQIDIEACPVCGRTPLTRRLIKRSDAELRGWVCAGCSHHMILPADILAFIETNRAFFSRG